MRTDPITGKRAWHNGVDIAGAAGVSVNAIASGIVNWLRSIMVVVWLPVTVITENLTSVPVISSRKVKKSEKWVAVVDQRALMCTMKYIKINAR
jgi:hypothetical protein